MYYIGLSLMMIKWMKAETEGYTYFKMSDDACVLLEKEAAGNYDEIWKVNQRVMACGKL